MKKILFGFLIVFAAGCSKEDLVGGSGTSGTNANKLSVGKSAGDLLSAAKFSGLQIEVAYMTGNAPDNAALNAAKSFLESLINKPGGITISQREIPASGKATLSVEEIRAIEDANRKTFNSGAVISIFLLYVDADYDQPNTLGVAYRNTSMALFGKSLKSNSGGLNQVSRTKLETTGLEHELGHLLGLVDLGSVMQVNHNDASHDKHCNNKDCLMYFATETNMMAGILLSSPIPTLDANCRNDLKANGGK